jgi:uncharacterized protein
MASQKIRTTAFRHFSRTSTYQMYAFAPEKTPSLVERNFCLAFKREKRNRLHSYRKENMSTLIAPIALLEKYYPPGSDSHRILLRHSESVAAKAVAVAQGLSEPCVDLTFVREAALLHDIGILFTAVPQLGCQGELPYLCHGIKGRELLEKEGLPRHGLVCERHIGVGLSAEEIVRQQLPLPARDMLPISVEEQIVTYADLFFSKNPAKSGKERSVDKVRKSLARHGEDKVAVFDAWHQRFGG